MRVHRPHGLSFACVIGGPPPRETLAGQGDHAPGTFTKEKDMETLSDGTRRMALRLAVQAIDHWRKAKASGLPKSAGQSRRYALCMIRAYKTGVAQ
jgi:hypothetical protein